MALKKKLIVPGLIASVALVLAGCAGTPKAQPTDAGVPKAESVADCLAKGSPEWQTIVAAAKKEGKVVMYSTLIPVIAENLEKAFESTYPEIDLQVNRILGQEVSTTLDAEIATGTDGADVVSHINYDWMFDHVDDKTFVVPVGPASGGPLWLGTDNQIDDVFQVSLLTTIGFAYRTDLIDSAPASYKDLLDPAYGGGVLGITDAQGNASVSVMMDFAEKEYGKDFVAKLAKQKPKVYATSQPALEALLAGEIAVTSWASKISVDAAASKGAPVKFVVPEKAWAVLNLTYMMAKSQRPNAAQVLYNFMACDAGQEALTAGNVSVLPDIPGTIAKSSAVTRADLDLLLDSAWVTKYGNAWADTMGR
jgi:iron(III) transport system substrate-binding protein